MPPPGSAPSPQIHILRAGTPLVRLFDPTKFGATAISMRTFGPLRRFDHHRPRQQVPTNDPDRGIYYAGVKLSCCVVEVFGDTGLVRCADWHAASPLLSRDVRLVDLRGSGAMRAGSVAAVTKTPDCEMSQAWSRYFYECSVFESVDGIVWYNAHNDEDAIALYERAAAALTCTPDRVIRLNAPDLRADLLRICEANNLILAP